MFRMSADRSWQALRMFLSMVARQGHMATCLGPPDKISEGSATVFINGKPAARMGDRTAHGDVVIRGSSNVFIGDGPGRDKSSDICPVAAKAAASSLYSDET